MTPPESSRDGRRYSGRVTAVIVLAIVIVFVLLNVVSARLVPEPDEPVRTPAVTVRPTT